MRYYKVVVLVIIFISSCAPKQRPTEPSKIASAILDTANGRRSAYFIQGSEKKGNLVLQRMPNGANNVFVVLNRQGETLIGRGRLFVNGQLRAVLAPLGTDDEKAKGNAQLIVVSGTLDDRILSIDFSSDSGAFSREIWQLATLFEPKQIRVTTELMKAGTWTKIEPPPSAKGPLRLRVKGMKSPAGGIFQRPPSSKINFDIEDQHVPLLSGADFSNAPIGLPDFIDAAGAAVWLIPINTPVWIADFGLEEGIIPLEILWESILPVWESLFECDPFFDLEVWPTRIARGENVEITVTASSEAGIGEVSWQVVDTPEPTARGWAISGRGEQTFTYSTNLRLNTAGFYQLRGSATRYGEGSETCYDSERIEVMPDARRTYTVAFVVLTEEDDQASASFREKIRRVNDVKSVLRREFQKATDFTGAIDVSYPTVTLAPPMPFPRNSDGPVVLYDFFRRVSQEFYRFYPDNFDFIAYYVDIPERLDTWPPGFTQVRPGEVLGSRHFTIRTKVSGLGLTYRNLSAEWGSAGRLRGVGVLRDVGELPETYSYLRSYMRLTLHELFGHQWGMYATALRDDGYHFQNGIQSDTYSVLYAIPWLDLGSGRFGIADIPDPETGYHTIKFHPWTLYLAGLKRRDEVPGSILKITTMPPWDENIWIPIERAGVAETITLDSIIAADGDRQDH